MWICWALFNLVHSFMVWIWTWRVQIPQTGGCINCKNTTTLKITTTHTNTHTHTPYHTFWTGRKQNQTVCAKPDTRWIYVSHSVKQITLQLQKHSYNFVIGFWTMITIESWSRCFVIMDKADTFNFPVVFVLVCHGTMSLIPKPSTPHYTHASLEGILYMVLTERKQKTWDLFILMQSLLSICMPSMSSSVKSVKGKLCLWGRGSR